MRFGVEFGSYPADLEPTEVCEQLSERAQVAYKNNFEALFVAQHYLAGPEAPGRSGRAVMAYHQEFGAEIMWFMVDWPGMDPRFTLETIERFGKEVIPEIKRLTPESPLP